jgi:hypothetical protein
VQARWVCMSFLINHHKNWISHLIHKLKGWDNENWCSIK